MIERMKHQLRTRLAAWPALLAPVLVLAALLASPATHAWSSPQDAAAPQADPFALGRKIPVDPKITVGTLPNGLRYYIRENKEPKNRADLRLVVNAGSVLEDEDQRGLAHFVEHMAFNGSKHFPRQKFIDFMQSIGMRFGPDLNAFTGFDETTYMLRIPTDSPEIIRTALLIMEDWAHNLTFDEKAIDKERGVIIEEWRLGQGAEARMRDKQFPVLFRGSRYAERQPIGKKETIESFKPETLKRFYRTWYRPDLMAVIIVGDFDRARMEDLVRKQFAGIPRDPKAPPRPVYPVPDHDETLVAVATDKEASRSTVAVFHKLPLRDQSTIGAYRQRTVEMLFNAMLNNRLNEVAQKPDPPFLGAGASEERFVASKELFALSALVPEGGILRGLRALYAEGERVGRFGFTATEFDRQKRDIARFYERALVEKETEDSADFAEEFTRSFLEGEPIPGIEYEHTLQSRFMPGISLDEVNRLAREWMTERNRVIMVNAPDKPSAKVPDAAALLAVLEDVRKEDLAAYKDTVSDAPLLAAPPAPGEIVSARTVETAGITEWTLSNGVRVVLKPTKFKEDEILLKATSPGGISLAPENDLIPANTADDVVSQGGLDGFSEVELQKKLAGKTVRLSPLIGELEEGLSGQRLAEGRGDPLPDDLPDVHRAAGRRGRLRIVQGPAQGRPREPGQGPGGRLHGRPPEHAPARPAPLPGHDRGRDPTHGPREIPGLLPGPVRRRGRLHLRPRRQPRPRDDQAPRPPLHRQPADARPQGDVEGLARPAARGRRQAGGRQGPRAEEPGGHRLLRALQEDDGEPAGPARGLAGPRDAAAEGPAREARRDLRRLRPARLLQDPARRSTG